MKRKYTAILLCLLSALFIFTACNNELPVHATYNNMQFKLYHNKYTDTNKLPEYYYAARDFINDNDVAETYFVPMFVNETPVVALDATHRIQSSVNADNIKLKNLYLPGTIDEQWGNDSDSVYVCPDSENFRLFYCGSVMDVLKIARHKDGNTYYVPANNYDEFVYFCKRSWQYLIPKASEMIFKANVVYNLNAEDMVQYYYVDYVEGDQTPCKIENIPPEPTRVGYKFDGWYIDKECYTKWNFDSIPIFVPTENNPDGEFNLYAKWTQTKKN